MSKQKESRIDRLERAVRLLAFYLQDPNHDEYRVLYLVDQILDGRQ